MRAPTCRAGLVLVPDRPKPPPPTARRSGGPFDSTRAYPLLRWVRAERRSQRPAGQGGAVRSGHGSLGGEATSAALFSPFGKPRHSLVTVAPSLCISSTAPESTPQTTVYIRTPIQAAAAPARAVHSSLVAHITSVLTGCSHE